MKSEQAFSSRFNYQVFIFRERFKFLILIGRFMTHKIKVFREWSSSCWFWCLKRRLMPIPRKQVLVCHCSLAGSCSYIAPGEQSTLMESSKWIVSKIHAWLVMKVDSLQMSRITWKSLLHWQGNNWTMEHMYLILGASVNFIRSSMVLLLYLLKIYYLDDWSSGEALQSSFDILHVGD